MKVAFPGSGQERIEKAFQTASATTGASFDYLVKTAIRESNLNPAAKAKTSTAAGTFQFIESTWLETLKEAGGRFGLDKYADKIERTSGGKYFVRDSETREQILNLRHDPEVSAVMAGALTQKNSKTLENFLGRKPSDGELYIAHFLGAAGAKRLIGLAESRPDATASSYFKAQAKANKPIFYNANGTPRSADAVYKNLINRHDGMELIGTALASVVEPRPKPAMASTLVALAATPLSKPQGTTSQGDSRSITTETPVEDRTVTPSDRVAAGWNVASLADDPAPLTSALKVAAAAASGTPNRFDQAFRIADASAGQFRLAYAAPDLKDYQRLGSQSEPVSARVAVAASTATEARTSTPSDGEALPTSPLAAAFRAKEPRTAFESLYRTDALAPRYQLGETFAIAYSAQTSLFSTEGIDAIEAVFGKGKADRIPVNQEASNTGTPNPGADDRRPRGLPMDLGNYRRVEPQEAKRELLPPV